MTDNVRKLAALMRLAKGNGGEKFVLMLGAGASLSSGIPTTREIMEGLVAQFDPGRTGDVQQRFDQLWKDTPDKTRRRFLEPYLLKGIPSIGYQKLVELIKAGYFDVVLSFNFDGLLERSLEQSGVNYADLMIRGGANEEEMQKLVDAKLPRVKLLKLHGSLDSADYFLFDSIEMHRYPEPIESLVKNVTRRDILVCGYSFNDTCVISAFSERGESIFCVNPSGMPQKISLHLKNRRSENNEIRSDFDTFFTALHQELLAPPPVAEKPPPNPFKFLESYDEHDAESFGGRELEIGKFNNFLIREPPVQAVVISGPSKAGKTSLVRAGLMAGLGRDAAKYHGVYLRCRSDIERQLPASLAELEKIPAGLDLPAAIRALGVSNPDQRVVLFLDQFERVTTLLKPQADNGEALGAFLRTRLLPGLTVNLMLVLVTSEEDAQSTLVSGALSDSGMPINMLNCNPFGRQQAIEIMQSLAKTAGFDFESGIIEDMAIRFEESKREPNEKRFTMAHMQAICHVLASERRVLLDGYEGTFKRNPQNLEALRHAINVVEFMSFAEDCDYPISSWIRNMVKVPLHESKDRIAAFIKTHYEDLVPPRERRSSKRQQECATGASP